MYTIVQLQYCFEISLIPLLRYVQSVLHFIGCIFGRDKYFLMQEKTDFQRTLPVTTDILIKNEIISILIENRKIIFHAVQSPVFLPFTYFHAVESCFVRRRRRVLRRRVLRRRVLRRRVLRRRVLRRRVLRRRVLHRRVRTPSSLRIVINISMSRLDWLLHVPTTKWILLKTFNHKSFDAGLPADFKKS